MDIKKVFCCSCAGTGEKIFWKAVDLNDDTCRIVKEENVCEVCNGKGYIEYATFTLEEAKAILKHCGLSTES